MWEFFTWKYGRRMEDQLPEPFTTVKTEMNLKPREVKCYNCNYTLITKLPGAQCGQCHSYLVNVIKPNELVGQLSSSTQGT